MTASPETPREASVKNKPNSRTKAKTMKKTEKTVKAEKKPVPRDISCMLLSTLAVAIRKVFSSGGPRDRKTAIRDVALELGYSGVRPNVKKRVDDALRAAVRRGIIQNDGTLLRLDCRSIKDYSREALVKHLLAALERTWWEEGLAIHWTADYLGYRGVTETAYKTLKATITTAIRRGLLERDGDKIRRCRG